MSELDLIDSILRHSLDLQRLSAHEEAQALEILRQLETELRQLLASNDLTDAGKREVNALIADAHEAIASSYAQIPGLLDTHELSLIVANRTADVLRDALPSVTIPSPERLASLTKDILIDGAPASAWWSRQAEDLQFKFAAQVRQGVLNGESLAQITARVVGSEDEPGILDTSRRNARSLVHSAVMTAANRARLETYRKNGRHIAGLRWLATLDSHTCMQCAALDGQAWNLDGDKLDGTTADFQLPPAHFACRCVATPIAKGLDDIFGTTGLDEKLKPAVRASSSGPTSAPTFEAFLERQSPEFVEEVLGKRRAELYLAGKLTLRDLVSGAGRPLTLDELRTR
ncbi:MAG: minor capsid protein [Novosphingobium sp.]|nr:minor capsid protein [Novosphingobium sp.]